MIRKRRSVQEIQPDQIKFNTVFFVGIVSPNNVLLRGNSALSPRAPQPAFNSKAKWGAPQHAFRQQGQMGPAINQTIITKSKSGQIPYDAQSTETSELLFVTNTYVASLVEVDSARSRTSLLAISSVSGGRSTP